jgi:putative transcriptional regulator
MSKRHPLATPARDEVPSVAALRAHFGMSQERFAALLEVSTKAVRNWEAGYPVHSGPARVLLRIANAHPHVVLDAMRDDCAAA